MAVLPVSNQEFLNFALVHSTTWADNAVAIGISPAVAAQFQSLTEGAQVAFEARLTAAAAARAATEAQNGAIAQARRSAADIIRMVRMFAENSNDPSVVYALAQIPAPATPSTPPPPGTPKDFAVGIDPASGSLQLKWKCENPPGTSGTSYIITRRSSASQPFAFIGVSGNRSFVDKTFVQGPDSVQYVVQASRNGEYGPPSQILTINFGAEPGSESATVASTSESANVGYVQPALPTARAA